MNVKVQDALGAVGTIRDFLGRSILTERELGELTARGITPDHVTLVVWYLSGHAEEFARLMYSPAAHQSSSTPKKGVPLMSNRARWRLIRPE